MYTIERYSSLHYDIWNEFVINAKNGTFLFHRDFMEYHSERFEDYSLMIFKKQKLVAVLPGNIQERTLYSHQGLTYGGLVYDSKIKLADVITVYREMLKFLNENNIKTLSLKPVPSIYHKVPAQEQEYVLFLLNANLVRRDGLSVIQYDSKLPIVKSRRQAARKGSDNNLKIVEEPNFNLFWKEILIPNLKNKYNTVPVHTVEEIEYLYERFPKHIRHFNVYYDDRIVAGTTMFITDNVAHPQYISGQEDKNALGSIDYLYSFLIETFSDKKYFDLGPSTEEKGRKLNEGVLFWKESFGARIICQDFYEVTTANYTLLEEVFN